MAYEIISHISELKIRVQSDSTGNLFREALRAMEGVLRTESKVHKVHKVERSLSINSPDRTALLADFLNEVNAQGQINKEIYTDVEIKKLTDTSIEAVLKGEKTEGFAEDIKAVTHHGAQIRETAGGVEVELIMDI